MTLRQRKFIGMVAIVAFLIVYCLIAMAVGGMSSAEWHLRITVCAEADWAPE